MCEFRHIGKNLFWTPQAIFGTTGAGRRPNQPQAAIPTHFSGIIAGSLKGRYVAREPLGARSGCSAVEAGKGWILMVTRHRIGAAVIALALAGVWTIPAPAAEVPAPAAEAPAPDVVKTALPASKATKPRVVKPRLAKKLWRHRPIRVASAAWSWGGSHRWAVSHVVLGVGF